MTSGNEDWELWLRLYRAGWDQVSVPEVLFKYRKHGVSMSVTTESGFEEGRRMVRDRNPELYEIESLRDLKRRWYPLLTIIGTENLTVEDAEVVPTPDRLGDTWGKYVVDARDGVDLDTDTLLRLAELLEANPNAAVARTTGEPPLTMLRRWNLHDSEATPTEVVVLDLPATGPNKLRKGTFPRDGWATPKSVSGSDVPVQRQRPEERGTMPNPEQW
jgi:hypothetical protein